MSRWRTGRTMFGASGLTVLGAIAPFLLGAQAVLIQRELAFGPAALGAAVSIFFATAALSTILGKEALNAMGHRGGLRVAGSLVALGNLGLAALAHTWPALLVAMAVLGVANAACQGAANSSVATLLPAQRRGLGFGIKQSAVPAAIMLGGLAVPTMTVFFGWRSTFMVIGAIGLMITLAGGRDSLGESSAKLHVQALTRRPAQLEHGPRVPLLLCGLAVVFASAAANFLGAYLASWSHEIGLSLEHAGILMATGSCSSVIARVALGYWADHQRTGHISWVISQMATGGVCLLFIGAVPSVWAIWLFGVLAFLLGWSWPGVLLYAVAVMGRDAPVEAASIVQSGAFLGGALGPVSFGMLVDVLGFQTTWWAAAGSFLVAAFITFLAGIGFEKDLECRPNG